MATRLCADQAAAQAGHVPVLLADVLTLLDPDPLGAYLDGTFGGGGYSRAILERNPGQLIAIDRDPAAVARGRELARQQPAFSIVEGCFGDMAVLLGGQGIKKLNGIVLDLGVSTPQLADPDRGFSFVHDGPLDMRMGRSGLSAADLVNRADESTLADIIYRYGEERASRRIARAIVAQRQIEPIVRTRQLAEIAARVLGRQGRIDPATRTFQALRIHVNDELGELERALAATIELLKPGGRLVVVSFHSLEDRIVKRFFVTHSGRKLRGSRHLPDEEAGEGAAHFRLLTRRPVVPSAEEIAANPRARSARLRAAERLSTQGEER